MEDLRREIGVIFQDYMRYDMLARENIGLGRIERSGESGAGGAARPIRAWPTP